MVALGVERINPADDFNSLKEISIIRAFPFQAALRFRQPENL